MTRAAAMHQLSTSRRCTYRYATKEDLPSLMAINDQFDIKWTEDKFIEIFHNNIPIIMAFDDSQLLLGYVVYFCVLDEGRIINLTVDKKQQGKSYGKQLVYRALDEIYDMNMHYVLLDVKTDNYTAINLYTTIGFQILCRRLNYYPESPSGDAYFMQLAL